MGLTPVPPNPMTMEGEYFSSAEPPGHRSCPRLGVGDPQKPRCCMQLLLCLDLRAPTCGGPRVQVWLPVSPSRGLLCTAGQLRSASNFYGLYNRGSTE